MLRLLVIYISLLFVSKIGVGQVGKPLVIGDHAPSLVLPTTVNTEESFSFPYNNKIILLFFWSSSVSSSEQNLFIYAKLNSKYSDANYKSCDGFKVISVALQSDRKTWEQDIKKYNLLKISNCIAQKGYRDHFVSAFNLIETPTSFLIDEFGKIIAINPDIRTIMGYLNERKNSFVSTAVQTNFSGKILIGDAFKELKSTKVYILNEKKDTIHKTSTNNAGLFYAQNINTSQNLTVQIFANNQIQDEDRVFLASENGEVLSVFNKNERDYACTILDIEMPYFRLLSEAESVIETQKSINIELTEYIFKGSLADLTPAAKLKFNAIISKLKTLPNCKVDIIAHTSCKGDSKLNLALSLKRANTILNYFVLKGIAKHRIKAIGKGETEPLNECVDGFPCTNDELEENNRTIFKIIEI